MQGQFELHETEKGALSSYKNVTILIFVCITAQNLLDH